MCVYVCMYVCMYVRTYVRMYIYIYSAGSRRLKGPSTPSTGTSGPKYQHLHAKYPDVALDPKSI